jgi:NAD(P)-dependent dehydrogenase (short-subunit alcohol dehydrogenase family)
MTNKRENHMINMKNKVVLITGGATGIGFAAARMYLAQGAKVVIAGRNVTTGNDALSSLQKISKEVDFFAADVSDPNSVQALISHTVNHFGRLDIAFNNAGIDGTFASITDIEDDVMNDVIDINLKGVWLCCKYQIKQFKAQQTGGAIVNTSSWLAKGAFAGSSIYSASKAALDGMTRALAVESGSEGIRINNVNPGYIKTPMLSRFFDPESEEAQPFKAHAPMQRFGESDDIAKSVLWLSSDAASFITGETLLIDGGISIGGQR